MEREASSSPLHHQACSFEPPPQPVVIPYLLLSDDVSSSDSSGAKRRRITNKFEFPKKVSIPGTLCDDDHAPLCYACGGGWVVLVYPSRGYEIKLYNISKQKEISNLIPPLPPLEFFYDQLPVIRELFDEAFDIEFHGNTLVEVSENQSNTLAKFILHGDPESSSPSDFQLVALFNRRLESYVQGALLVPASASKPRRSSWVPIINKENNTQLLDAVVHWGRLWAIDELLNLSAFPIQPEEGDQKFVRVSESRSFSGIYPSRPLIDNYSDKIYLLPKSGVCKFLAVVRYVYNKMLTEPSPTYFRLYELSFDHGSSIKELTNLDNNTALFLGDNASFSLQVVGNGNGNGNDDYDCAAAPKANCIYFSEHFSDLDWSSGEVGVYNLITRQVETVFDYASADAAPVPQWISF